MPLDVRRRRCCATVREPHAWQATPTARITRRAPTITMPSARTSNARTSAPRCSTRNRPAMRGKIDLGDHKLAGLFRPPAKRTPWYARSRIPATKRPDATYRQIWSIVDGAVSDTFANHPEYIAPNKQRAVIMASIVKRVTGSLHGYATQVARGRSVLAKDVSPDAAANRSRSQALAPVSSPVYGVGVGHASKARDLWRRVVSAAQNFLEYLQMTHAPNINAKVEYVKAQPRSLHHTCHWPGCECWCRPRCGVVTSTGLRSRAICASHLADLPARSGDHERPKRLVSRRRKRRAALYQDEEVALDARQTRWDAKHERQYGAWRKRSRISLSPHREDEARWRHNS